MRQTLVVRHLSNLLSGLVLAGLVVTGRIKCNKQMMFNGQFIVDRSDSAMHSSKGGDDLANMATSPSLERLT